MKRGTVLVVNTILAECRKHKVFPRPMKLQKLLYFCHGEYLVETEKDLISDNFEAWGYGCVVPEVYHAFKHWGYREIKSLLVEQDEKGARVLSEHSDKYPVIQRVVDKYCRMNDMILSDINHQVNGAWWQTKVDGNIVVEKKYIVAEFKKEKNS